MPKNVSGERAHSVFHSIRNRLAGIRKRYLIIIILIILSVALIVGYTLLSGGDDSSSHLENPHFAVGSISSQPVFTGENVIVRAIIMNDEPEQEIAIPTTTELTITPGPDDTKGTTTVTTVPTTIVQTISARGSHIVTARLSGDQSVDTVRAVNVLLASGESKVLSFDFGQVPSGSYVVTVTAPSYNNSTMSRSLRVNPAPLLSDWIEIGDIAIQLVNLEHGSVDINVRNSGEHTVVFSDSHYAIFANCSDGYVATLQGLGQTMIKPGKTETIHVYIPIPWNYYLDCFAIKVPERTALVKIPVKAQMSAAT